MREEERAQALAVHQRMQKLSGIPGTPESNQTGSEPLAAEQLLDCTGERRGGRLMLGRLRSCRRARGAESLAAFLVVAQRTFEWSSSGQLQSQSSSSSHRQRRVYKKAETATKERTA